MSAQKVRKVLAQLELLRNQLSAIGCKFRNGVWYGRGGHSRAEDHLEDMLALWGADVVPQIIEEFKVPGRKPKRRSQSRRDHVGPWDEKAAARLVEQHGAKKWPCAWCGGPVPDDSLSRKNCCRTCTVRLADRKRRGAITPVHKGPTNIMITDLKGLIGRVKRMKALSVEDGQSMLLLVDELHALIEEKVCSVD